MPEKGEWSMSRLWARISIVLAAAFVVGMIVGAIIHQGWPVIVGGVAFLASMVIKLFVLRCPTCGWGGGIPQWKNSGNIHCPKCGSVMWYDK